MQQTQARCNRIARSSGEHCHDFPQLLLGWRGEMNCELEKEAGSLNATTAAIIPANERHIYAGRNDCSELLVIDLSSYDSCLSMLEKDANIDVTEQLFSRPLLFDMPPILVSTVSLAVEQLRFFGPRDSRYLLRRQLAMMFVTQIYELMAVGSLEVLPKNCRISASDINSFIDASLEIPPSNSALSDFLHLGQSQMHLLFVRHFGKSPQQYVLERRLSWAMKWLQTTRLPLGRIAMDLGFSDSSSFSRAFRKQFGHAPSAIRSQSAARTLSS
ncbi:MULTISPECIES: AraC family transcriptional regulator [Halomonadaceae]|uniref:AraC family transcriptional regulator n=1 Tax=Vreelandella TaxID=3137766 RepID=UPI0023E89905|nr:AraC family transcriptional regulator [Halomonas titanicae]|tara:strand:- start:4851 stop:5666 length:816 start_codon:yes stop_codon:yes gene_type:complete